MPLAKLKATAVTAKAPPTAMIQPVRGSSRRRRLRTAIPIPPTSASPSSQPAWPPSASFSSRSGPVEPPKAPPPPMPPGPPAWPSSRPKPLYSRISEKTLLSVVPGDPGPARGRRQFDHDRPGEGDRDHRRARREQLAQRGGAAARRDPEPGQRHPRHDHQRRAHLRLEAEPDADAGEDQPAGARRPRAPARTPTAPRRSRGPAARRGCCGGRPRPRSGSAPAPGRRRSPPARPQRRRVRS